MIELISDRFMGHSLRDSQMLHDKPPVEHGPLTKFPSVKKADGQAGYE
jgi:hypothetical protein